MHLTCYLAYYGNMNIYPRIIAICGKKRCGKDTLAKHIENTLGYKHVKIATQLKHVMQMLFGFTESQIEHDLKDVIDVRWGITPRQAMQFFGTEIMQFEVQKLLPHIGRTFWIKGLLAQHDMQIPLVISDLRFKHEIDELRAFTTGKVMVVKIERPVHQGSVTESSINESHSSELEYNDIAEDIKIKNDGDIEKMLHAFDVFWKKSVEIDNTMS